MPVTTGDPGVTSGARALPPSIIAYAIIVLGSAVFATVNILSAIDEHGWRNAPIAWWEPTIWETTSVMVLLALAWIPGQAVRLYPPTGAHALRNAAVHLACSVPFSLIHVAAMVALREAAYALLGGNYEFGGADAWFYEYRKDLVSYAIYALIFWLTRRLSAQPEAARSAPAASDAMILIDEGTRQIRIDASEILGARSSGNYVEYLLADGRRPLMRTTLAGIEAVLAEHGFVRTHRSWLVNRRHVTAIEAQGSGDHALTLADGTQAPLSRRYREALAALRSA